MSIKQIMLAALSGVLANTWAVELPLSPVWPALVFDIDTTPETGWVMGGGYDQHTVNVVILARSLGEIEALQVQVDAALSVLAGYLRDDDRGDADYEGDASVYGYFSTHVLRTRR
jgi:hypothetical protein